MRLFIIRHADPDYPNHTITAAGHLEARALAKRMQRLGPDRIYHSPLGRAIDTMRYTAEALGADTAHILPGSDLGNAAAAGPEQPPVTPTAMEPRPGLVPQLAPWTAELAWAHIEQETLGFTTSWDVHGHTIHGSNQELTRNNWHLFPPLDLPEFRAGFERIQAESDLFLAGLGYEREGGVYRVTRANREKVALFCHLGFGLSWLAHLLNIPLPLVWTGFFLPPSSVTTVLFDERAPGLATPRCLGLGGVSHLYAEGLSTQPAGIKANLD